MKQYQVLKEIREDLGNKSIELPVLVQHYLSNIEKGKKLNVFLEVYRDEALERAIADLDGFYTFAIGTRDGFAVLRDPIGCKPAILAETDDWVAMASEFRAIACLPGVENADIWEPSPAKIYSWQRTRQ